MTSGRAEAGSETTDSRTAIGEFVFLNLRLRNGFSLRDFERRFATDFDSLYGEIISRLIREGLLERNGGHIRLTERGIELADSVFAEFV
jgi:oxygen-independent coproporphyrinogen-3 oxidase